MLSACYVKFCAWLGCSPPPTHTQTIVRSTRFLCRCTSWAGCKRLHDRAALPAVLDHVRGAGDGWPPQAPRQRRSPPAHARRALDRWLRFVEVRVCTTKARVPCAMLLDCLLVCFTVSQYTRCLLEQPVVDAVLDFSLALACCWTASSAPCPLSESAHLKCWTRLLGSIARWGSVSRHPRRRYGHPHRFKHSCLPCSELPLVEHFASTRD